MFASSNEQARQSHDNHQAVITIDNIFPEICQALFSLLGTLSTISHDSFMINSSKSRSNSVSFNPYCEYNVSAKELSKTTHFSFRSEHDEEQEEERIFNQPPANLSMSKAFQNNLNSVGITFSSPFIPLKMYETQEHHVIIMLQTVFFLLKYALSCNAGSFGNRRRKNAREEEET